LFVGVAAGYLQLASSRYADFEHEVGQGPDRFLSDARGRLVESARRTIDARLDSDAELLVLPEGVLLNYLTRRASPTPYVNFMPPELAFFGEETMLEALRANPPELVALVHKDTSEYGFRFFGRDYGLELMRWLEANYRRGQLIGSQPFVDERFGIVLYERN